MKPILAMYLIEIALTVAIYTTASSNDLMNLDGSVTSVAEGISSHVEDYNTSGIGINTMAISSSVDTLQEAFTELDMRLRALEVQPKSAGNLRRALKTLNYKRELE